MIKKFLVAYGFWRFPLPDDTITHMAKFDMIDTGFNLTTEVQRIKAINPEVKVIGYLNCMGAHPDNPFYPEVSAHEDWFLHDLNGNRMTNKYWGWEALDVSNPEWQSFYVNRVLTHCRDYGFDGVFVDDVWEWLNWHNTVWTVDKSLIPPEYKATWHSRMLDFISNVKAKIGGYLMILNNSITEDYIELTRGYLIENFLRDGYVEGHLEALMAHPDKIKVCSSHEAGRLFSFAASLLVDNTYWGYATTNYFPNDEYKGYPPEMDIDVGEPRGSYYEVNDLLYGRDFDNVKAFANFSASNTYTVEVEDEPYEVPPHSGLIVPWEAPPKPPEEERFFDRLWDSFEEFSESVGLPVPPKPPSPPPLPLIES